MKYLYDKRYFHYQKKAAEYGALIDLFKFEKYIKESDSVLDFGCGGGDISEKLSCRRRYGVDINPLAVRKAQKRGIITYRKIAEIPKHLKFEVIISHHALEHVENPLETLRELRRYLKKDGLMIFVIPIDDWRKEKHYQKNNIDRHLYTWTPLLIGNLFSLADYEIIKVEILSHAWIPLSKFCYQNMPSWVYYLLCRIWSYLTFNRQIRIIATI